MFQIFSETSKTGAGSALYQIQNGPPKLIGYASKGAPPSAVNHSIAELELLGLCVNINQFKHLHAKVDFDHTVDHLALTYIKNSKTEPASARIKRPLEVLNLNFNLLYMKEKDMTLGDFLPRIKVHKSNPHKIIPISFDLKEVLHEKYYIQTRSGAKKEGFTVGKIHEHDKSLLPHLKPEKAAKILSQFSNNTALPNHPQIPTNVPISRRVGRAGLRSKVPGTKAQLKPKVFSQSPQI